MPPSSTPEPVDFYRDNPLTNRDRRLAKAESVWARSFSCEDVRPLIVCRGPIRKEAIDVFTQLGITDLGILLSDKDSIVYTGALAPELRQLKPHQVHRVLDYTGVTSAERSARIAEIIQIAHDHGYDSVFAGYGFMAEDAGFVRAIEDAGLRFIGPCSRTVHAAGQKDEAKRTALTEEVSVTPGVNDVTTRLVLRKAPDAAALAKLAKEGGVELPASTWEELKARPAELAESLLDASYAAGVDLYSIDELAEQVVLEVAAMLRDNPGNRVRLKAIGGGGGKGQRIVNRVAAGDAPLEERVKQAAAPAAGMAREILSEVKATGVGDNKNILIELNIEETRHNEIQLIGNGEWCLAMGGRDCSLQMHEQKLLEVSITQEGLAAEIAAAKARGNETEAKALEMDLVTLQRMEAEGERFGRAVGLDSASTFECIVERDHHFFMEVNTRIQVEHRVSELCYALRFENPDDPEDAFVVDSLVECMVLLSRHGPRLPRPIRTERFAAALEARLNATDRALQPHAGGVIRGWTDPIEGEIRDDQGICIKNPDTGIFVHYRLAGAYDSNIALLVTEGTDRRDSYLRLSEILRRTRLRGQDLATNLEFHHGLVHWFLARNVMAKPTTRFVVPYLTQVGLLKEAASEIDVLHGYGLVMKHYKQRCGDDDAGKKRWKGFQDAFTAKQTLFKRPLDRMWEEPHFLSAWLSYNRGRFEFGEGGVRWLENPVRIIADTYWLMNMNYVPGLPAAQVMWDHDHELLTRALKFYERLDERLGGPVPYPELVAKLEESKPPPGFDADLWQSVRASHAGFQAGFEILGLLVSIGDEAGFEELKVEEVLTITIPERLTDPSLQDRMRKVLVPPPATQADAILAASGGMFYAQEAPGRPAFVEVGDHFEVGQPLYVIEVMKMFNKVLAPFAGTIDERLIETDGTIVRKGQPVFKVTPDEKLVEEDPKERLARVHANTARHVARILGN